jgi:hypothetical protein
MPEAPIETYKRIIDSLVEFTPSVSADLIINEGIYSRGRSEFTKEMNGFVRSLSPEQRQTLAKMLTDERRSGIGQVLADLTWWITCHGVGLTVHGAAMPVELSGMGLEGDYVGRLDDWDWPKGD